MAGAKARASVMVPCAFSSSFQPSTTPGTVTASGPRTGISLSPFAANASGVAPDPARPLAFSAAQLARLPVVDDGEQVSADSVHRRFDDGQHRSRRHGRVDGVAAFLEHGKTGGGGQRLARGNHAVPGHDDGTGGAGVAGRAVTGRLGEDHGARHSDKGGDGQDAHGAMVTHRQRIPAIALAPDAAAR